MKVSPALDETSLAAMREGPQYYLRRNLVRSDGTDRLFTKWRVSQSFVRGPAPGRFYAAVSIQDRGTEARTPHAKASYLRT